MDTLYNLSTLLRKSAKLKLPENILISRGEPSEIFLLKENWNFAEPLKNILKLFY